MNQLHMNEPRTIKDELSDIARRWMESGKMDSDAEHVQTFTLLAFVRAVNRRAELNMVKTGKLEGSHYAAMNKLLEELGIKP